MTIEKVKYARDTMFQGKALVVTSTNGDIYVEGDKCTLQWNDSKGIMMCIKKSTNYAIERKDNDPDSITNIVIDAVDYDAIVNISAYYNKTGLKEVLSKIGAAFNINTNLSNAIIEILTKRK